MVPVMINRFGIALKEARTRRRISQNQLAREACVSSGYISRLEGGHFQPPSIQTIQRIARCLVRHGEMRAYETLCRAAHIPQVDATTARAVSVWAHWIMQYLEAVCEHLEIDDRGSPIAKEARSLLDHIEEQTRQIIEDGPE